MSFADHDDADDFPITRNVKPSPASSTPSSSSSSSRANRERLGLDNHQQQQHKNRSKTTTTTTTRMNNNNNVGPTASHSTRPPQFVKQVAVDIDDDDNNYYAADGVERGNHNNNNNNNKQPNHYHHQQTDSDVMDHQEIQDLQSAKKLLADVTSNIHEIQRLSSASKKLVDQLGSKKDTHDLRHRLNKNIEAMTGFVRGTAPLLKQLYDLAHLDDNIRQQHSILKRQFEEETVHFRNLTEEASKKQKLTIRQVKARTVSLEKQAAGDLIDGLPDLEAQEKDPLVEHNAKRLELLTLQNEISHNEAVIAEREDDIREIEVTIREVNDIFKDLGVMVVAQGEDLDTIENMVSETKGKTEKAAQELTKANKYQAAALGKMLLIIVIVIIVAIVATIAVVVFLKFFLSGLL